MDEMDEQIYKRYLAKRSENDLRILLERYKEGLILFLYNYVHNMEDAEDLMLDAYARIASGTGLFAGRSSFKTWLFSIGKKLAFMHLRKSPPPSEQLDESLNDESDPLDLGILQDEQNRQLYQALRQLKPEYQQILTLLYFEQMSHEEAARVMGKTKKQTYHLAERGKAALKEKLEQMGFENAYN
ncbi:MAG: RNA polymerase sigma factor [Coriobacteriales bacterium]|nr:RNA polymerase sigma factor [Coriobacteriales bacterium]